ncbi:uncharacterized protein [Antedon mediterranea]|uniref:uncharacterized protein n=1 Tax=Antedon mediterranea TaxID=105859 RepID=UPI003AF4DF9F
MMKTLMKKFTLLMLMKGMMTRLNQTTNHLSVVLNLEMIKKPSPPHLEPLPSRDDNDDDGEGKAALFDTELEDSTGPDNIPGYAKVEALADYLMQFKEDSGVISQSHAEHVAKLWNNLDAYDKTIKRKARHQDYLTKGRFKKSKTTSVIPGVEST